MRRSSFLKWSDRYIGIPVVFFLGFFSRRRKKIPECREIALLCTAAIGDTILISAIIADLKRHFSNAAITFFVGASNLQAAFLIEGVDVVEIPVSKPWKAIEILRKQRFDLWIDCGQWARINALFSFFAKAQVRVGFKTKGQFRHFIYDLTVLHQRIHELDNFRNLIKSIGIEAKSPPRLRTAPSEAVRENEIVIHMFAGGSSPELRHWAEKNWISLINRLIDEGYSVALTGARSDFQGCERVKNSSKNPTRIEVLAGISLKHTAERLIQCKAVISVNTGIMHLAAALGSVTIGLHGPTCPKRWGPIGPRTAVVSPPCVKGALLHLGFEKVESNMESISEELVWAALQNSLETKEKQ